MVTAEFEADKDKGFVRMDVKGHAGFAELGKDPVCAGASTLAMTAAQYIDSMGKAGKLKKRPDIRAKNGRVSVVAAPKEEYYAEAVHTLLVVEIGMRLLEASYHEHAKVTKMIVMPQKG